MAFERLSKTPSVDWSHVMAQQMGRAVTKTQHRPVPDANAFLTLQTLCEANRETTLVSTDGVSAFVSMSQEAMLRGLWMESSPLLWNTINTCGRTFLVMSTQSSRAKGRCKGTLSCPSCTPLGSTKHCEAMDRITQVQNPEPKV